MENIEYIDNYFNDLQTQEQKILFEQMIESDEIFAKEVAFYISTNTVLKEELIKQKKNEFKKIYHEQKIIPVKIIPLMSKWRYIAAASIVIAIIFFTWLINGRNINTQELTETYISKNLQTLGITMGTNQDSLQNGLNLFNNGKYTAALMQFELIINRDSTDDTVIKYAGIAALQLKQYNTAIFYFTKLEKIVNLYSNPGKFYKALTLLNRNNNDDKKEAKILLQDVVNNNLEGKDTASDWLRKM